MGSLAKNLAKIGTVLAISSLALVGCSATPEAPSGSNNSSSSSSSPEAKVKASSAEAAATFANRFFAALIEKNTTDYSQLTPPIELTEAQAEQLMLDGKVDGVPDEKLNELVDYLYENHPLGSFIYFDDSATIQERLQVISALILAQSYADTMAEEQDPEKILAEDVTVNETDGEVTSATFEAEGSALAPQLVFVDGQWFVDGKGLLDSIVGPAAEDATSAPLETPAG